MRIAIVIHSMHGGGAERVAATLANAWVDRGHEPTIITFAGGEDTYSLRSSVRRVRLERATQSQSAWAAIGSNLGRLVALRQAIRRADPEVVLAMMAISSVLARLAVIGLGVRVVASERSFPPRLPLGRAWEFLRRRVYPHIGAVVSLTSKGAEWIAGNCPGSRSIVIPNPVAWPLPSSEPRIDPNTIVPDGRRLLLAAGRLEREKGFDRLLDAFSRLVGTFPEWDLAIIGEGAERANLMHFTSRSGMEARVRFPGRVGNVQDWYERADLFAMSSEFEGFPNVLVEAMACGCPVVSFDCDTGPRDIVRHEIDGLLVPPDAGAAGLASALASLMTDDARREAMGERATMVRSRFSLDAVSRRWESLFAELCDQRGAA